MLSILMIIIELLCIWVMTSISLITTTVAIAPGTSKCFVHHGPLIRRSIMKSRLLLLHCSSSDELTIIDTSEYGVGVSSDADDSSGSSSSGSNINALRAMLEKNVDSRNSSSLSRYSKPISIHNMPRYEFTGLVDENYGKIMVPRKPIRRILKGMVVSDKGNKTIVVRVERTVLHKKYRKYIKKSSRIMAHDEENRYKNGDMVKIRDCRPLSKRKFFETFDDEKEDDEEEESNGSASDRQQSSSQHNTTITTS